MLHYPWTTDQKENNFFFLSEINDTARGMNIKLEVFPESYGVCGKPERLHKKNFESLFFNYLGSFPLPVGDLRTKKYSSNAHQFSIENTSQVSYTSISFSEVNGKWFDAQPWRSLGADELDYELHLVTKLDYIM